MLFWGHAVLGTFTLTQATPRSEIALITTRFHFRRVFSSQPAKQAHTPSEGYTWRKNSASSRWCGCHPSILAGFVWYSLFHNIAHSWWSSPKWALKRRRLIMFLHDTPWLLSRSIKHCLKASGLTIIVVFASIFGSSTLQLHCIGTCQKYYGKVPKDRQ